MFYTFFLLVFSLPLVLIFYRYILGLFFRLFKSAAYPYLRIGDVERDYTWQPVCSFTIACFNEGEHIYHTVKSVLAQNWPKEKLEVIVVDDGSVDDSYQWAMKAKELGSVTVIRNETNMGKRRSLIVAERHASGEILVTVDSDVIVAPDALMQLVSCFAKNPEIGGVGGTIGVSNINDSWLTQSVAIRLFFAQQLFKATENTFQTVMCLSACLTAYRREAVEEVNKTLWERKLLGLPISYGEDRYLTHRLILNGWKTILNFDAKAWTKSPVTLQQLFAQQLRWRRSSIVDWILALRTFKKHILLLNPIVLFGYFSFMCYVIIYPFAMAHTMYTGFAVSGLVAHLAVLVVLGIIYKITTLSRREPSVNNPIAFLGLGLTFFVSYLIITPLAMFTLDSTSWETRQKQKEDDYEIEI